MQNKKETKKKPIEEKTLPQWVVWFVLIFAFIFSLALFAGGAHYKDHSPSHDIVL